ncbi:MAG: aminotransferase class I/II-fold pyridoxal phosphate-dependent enzyme [Leptolyngbyaceae bacterium]|nr:aminotransferase class I/II-fold pyridoxal phosphate-dependent enzyme [Leptolyngbyaceae bacterium]
MLLSSSLTPLVRQLQHFAERSHAAFYTPGHKRGTGASNAIKQLLGDRLFAADLPELPGLDTLFNPEGVIQDAQQLAAQTFGADQSWFLANGSTCGIEAAVLATCKPGDRLIVPRNLHQSVVSALILGGVTPVFVAPDADDALGIAHGVSVHTLQTALDKYPDVAAVMVTYPTYYGVGCDVGAIAHLVHQHGIPLLVDEAHGAHFGFHPDLPPSALSQGADLTVQSTHKVLAALTQASMLHIQGDRISPERVSRALQLVQSSSPSYLLLASLDAARAQMQDHGHELMAHTLSLAQHAREAIAPIPGIKLFELDTPSNSAAAILDPTRLTVDVSGLGITGFDADEQLHEELGVTAELPGLKTLTFIISLGNTAEDVEHLVRSLQVLSERCPSPFECSPLDYANSSPALPSIDRVSVPAVSPRDAFFAENEPVAIAQAIGRISAELVCPYPPGIPVLLPGERVTAEAVQLLQEVSDAGGIITGCADSDLTALTVVRED